MVRSSLGQGREAGVRWGAIGKATSEMVYSSPETLWMPPVCLAFNAKIFDFCSTRKVCALSSNFAILTPELLVGGVFAVLIVIFITPCIWRDASVRALIGKAV